MSISIGAARSRGGSPYGVVALVMCGLVFLGFFLSYFGPMLSGVGPPMTPLVHVHGATLFAWYLLLPVQASLIGAGSHWIHRNLGWASIGLVVLMFGTGVLLLLIGVHRSL